MKTPLNLRPLVFMLGTVLALLIICCAYEWLESLMSAQTISEQHLRLANTRKQAKEMLAAQSSAKQVATMVTQRAAGWGWSEQLPVSITQLSALEQAAGVTADTLQPATIAANQQLTRFPLRLTLHTDLAGLTKFLQQAQWATPLCAIDQLAIEAGKTPGERMLVNLTLSTYTLVNKAATTGGKP